MTNRVQFMSFDTTASNTGLTAGARVLLVEKMKTDLVSLVCRQHIHELIVAKVFIIIIIIIINEHFDVHTVNLINVMLNYTYK